MGRRVMILLGLLMGVSMLAFGQAPRPVDPADDQPDMIETAAPTDLQVLYNGEDTLSPQIALGDWGFIPRLSKDNPYQPVKTGRKTYAINVVSMSRYQGMRLDMATPPDSEQLLNIKGAYLEIYFKDDNRFSATQPTTTTTTPGGPGAAPTTPMGPPQPGPMVPGMPGMTGTNQPDTDIDDGPPAPKESLVPAPKLDSLRVTLYTDKGTVVIVVPKSEFFPMTEVNRQWLRIGIPLFNLKTPFGGKLTRIVLTTEKPASFLIGRIAIVQDTAPMQLQTSIFPGFLQAGKRVIGFAKVRSGLARYETTWNFDKDAEKAVTVKGDRVTHIYDTEGTYIVTCTIRDLTGAKPTVSKDAKLKVTAATE